MKKVFIILPIILITGAIIGFFVYLNSQSFENLSAEEMYKKIIFQRDFAINKAIESEDYKCCINPPCTMCYMEANEWNNFTAGTCACDDLIAQGKDPCPQCKKGLCKTCKFELEDEEVIENNTI